MRCDSLDDPFKLDMESIEFGVQIGWGAFSNVYKAKWHETEVVIKRYDMSDSEAVEVY